MDITDLQKFTLPGDIEPMTLENWKDLAAAGKAPERALIPKDAPFEFGEVEKDADGNETRTIPFTITTGARDRDRDVLDPKGWDTANYEKNPVILYGHQYRALPIGQTLSLQKMAKSIKAKALFVSGEIYEFADTVYQMVKGKFLRAASVGFMPQEWTYDEENRGYNFLKNELLEWSVVPVPSNPEALSEAKSAGIDMTPMIEYAAKLLDEWEEENGIFVRRNVFEELHKLLTDPVIPVEIDLKDEEEVDEEKRLSREFPISINVSPGFELSDEQIAELMEYIRDNFNPTEGGVVSSSVEVEVVEEEKDIVGFQIDKEPALYAPVSNCSRCDQDHERVAYYEFAKDDGTFTHWALCPETGDPMAVKVSVFDPNVVDVDKEMERIAGELGKHDEISEGEVDWVDVARYLGVEVDKDFDPGLTEEEVAEVREAVKDGLSAIIPSLKERIQEAATAYTGRLD